MTNVNVCTLLLFSGVLCSVTQAVVHRPRAVQDFIDKYYSHLILPRTGIENLDTIAERSTLSSDNEIEFQLLKVDNLRCLCVPKQNTTFTVKPEVAAFIRNLDKLRQQSLVAAKPSPSRTSSMVFESSEKINTNGKIAQHRLMSLVAQMKKGDDPAISEEIWPLSQDVLNGKPTEAKVTGAKCNAATSLRCDSGALYRRMDGACNNPRQPRWGAAGTEFIRIIPNNYIDGLMVPRAVRADGTALPSGRAVSVAATSVDEAPPSQHHSVAVMQWGQFIDHDITHIVEQSFDAANGVNCCNHKSTEQIPECFPITVAADDPLYQGSLSCINFHRSIIGSTPGCDNQAAQQVDTLTHFLDASNVYGSGDDELARLRAGASALMKTSGGNKDDLLRRPGKCAQHKGQEFCYVAGDSRSNEQPWLTAFHKMWVIAHNKIAQDLMAINPRASAEDIFQETRAIVIALSQKITYNDWLPLILGSKQLARHKLNARGKYNDRLNPSIVNEFAGAAFRFGHSLVNGVVREKIKTPLSSTFFNLGSMLADPARYVPLLRSITQTPMETMDNTFTLELAGKLFRTDRPLGLDLVALNVQRGRDHGLATYTQLRNHLASVCDDLTPVNSWHDLSSIMFPDQVDKLRALYGSVAEIDLFIGGVSERTVHRDAVVGPTFSCLLGDQFARLKFGDRHFYNNLDSMFSKDIIKSIDSVNLATVLCMATPLQQVQPNPFLLASKRNKLVSCNSIPSLDLSPWSNVLPRSQ